MRVRIAKKWRENMPHYLFLREWSHVKKKKAPLTTVNFLLPVTGGHWDPNGKRACFFPVIFRSFESLSVVTNGQTDALKGYQLSPFFKVERIIVC